MPKAEAEVVFDFPLVKVRKSLSDLRKVGLCQRFVEKVEVSPEGVVRWMIKSPMSKVTRTPHVDASLTNLQKRRFLSWKAEGAHLLWSADITLEDLPEQRTKAKLKLEVQGLGPLAPIINQLAGAQIKGNLDFFIDEIKKKMEE